MFGGVLAAGHVGGAVVVFFFAYASAERVAVVSKVVAVEEAVAVIVWYGLWRVASGDRACSSSQETAVAGSGVEILESG